MFRFSWRRFQKSVSPSSQLSRSLRARPTLEVLEDRTVPATITVTGPNQFVDTGFTALTSTGNGSYTAVNLRSAILGADMMSGPDTILLSTGRYYLQGDVYGALLVNDSSGELTIKNNFAGISIIDGQGLSRIFLNQAVLTLQGVDVTGGYVVGQGGGIFNNGVLTLLYSQVEVNEADGDAAGNPAQGGGIFNNGNAPLTVIGTTISGNIVRGGTNAFVGSGGRAEGAGIYMGKGSSLFTNIIDESTFSDNQAIGGDGVNLGGGFGTGGVARGGGLFMAAGNHPLLITNSTFSGNLVQGGDGDQADGGDAVGGGLSLQTGGAANATLANNTIAFNKAFGGSGSGAAGVDGVGSGGGVASNFILGGYPLAKFINTIIAKNSADFAADASGPFTSLGHNLIGDSTGASDSFNSNRGDYTGGNGSPLLDPGLQPLGNYGGPTWTHRLADGSFAIDRGSSSVLGSPFNLTRDQRGNDRMSGLFVDIGAFERIQPAANKSYSMVMNSSLTATTANGLLSGLSNPENKPLSVQLVQPPAGGALSLKGDGSFTYAAPHAYVGPVSFTFRILVSGAPIGTYAASIRITKAPAVVPGR